MVRRCPELDEPMAAIPMLQQVGVRGSRKERRLADADDRAQGASMVRKDFVRRTVALAVSAVMPLALCSCGAPSEREAASGTSTPKRKIHMEGDPTGCDPSVVYPSYGPLPPPVPERAQVVVACSEKDETYVSTCGRYGASPALPRAAPPYACCPAELPRGDGPTEPSVGAATFDPDVSRVMCSGLGCGYSYCEKAAVADPARAAARPSCEKPWERPVCIAAPPAGVSFPAPAPYPECPAALELHDSVQRLDVEATLEARRVPASAHACCYMQCFSYPG